VNKTGLAGRYDFTLRWTPSQEGAPNGAVPDNGGPSSFTAFEEQLGLKLVSAKARVEVIVIDHVDRPSPN
jgi:uncharacterized protein (TIGR03435 family)